MGHGLDVGRLLQPVVCLLLIVESRFNVEAIAFDNAILRARNTCSFRIVVDLEDPIFGNTADLLAAAFDDSYLIKRQPTLDKVKNLDYGVFCDVCYLERAETDFFDLGCGHRFCNECTRDHLQENIA